MRRFKEASPENIALAMVRSRVRKMSRFYMHLFIYIIGLLIYLAKAYYGAPFNFWPIKHINSFFMWVWTFFVVLQGIQLFLSEKVFGVDWERRKLQEFMNKDKQTKWD